MKGRKTLRETYAENNAADRFHAAMHGVAPKAQMVITPVRAYTRSDRPLESDVKNAIAARLKTHPKVAWFMRINSGATMEGGRSIRFYFLYLRGFPVRSKDIADFVGQLTDGRCFGLEVKRDHKETATTGQAEFLDAVNKGGGVGRIVTSVDEAERAIG